MNILETVIILTITVLPTILLWEYIVGLDKFKEPKKVLIKLFCAGFLAAVLTTILTLILECFSENIIDYNVTLSIKSFLYVFFCIGLIEEFSKFILMYLFGWNIKEHDETYDTVLYCMLVALGFATIENLLYSLSGGTILSATLRFFTAVPGHVIDGAFMGYFAYKVKLKKTKYNFFLAIIIPALTHTIYDFIALSADNLFITLLFVGFVVLEAAVAIKLVRKMARESKPLKKGYNYCTDCGTRVDLNFCPNCGKRNVI